MPGEFAVFFGFDHLVQAAFPAAVGHDAAGVFVDDLNFSVGEDVVFVFLKHVQGQQGLLYEFVPPQGGAPQALVLGALLFEQGFAALGEPQAFFVDEVVLALL